MHEGKIHESGDPQAMFAKPETPEFASFIGSLN